MKNQYFGDIGDYGKYGLLRYLADRGLSVAINWYLTPDDETNDGNMRGYLSKEKDRRYDPELYDVLREMCARHEKDVGRFATLGMIPDAIYFDGIVEPKPGSPLSNAKKREARACWHQNALEACDGAELVFMDPDTGLRPGCPSARKDAAKFVFASEICDYYDRGQDVIYYCHKGHRTDAHWERAKHIMLDCRPDAVLMGVTYHRGTQRSYIFMVHPQRRDMYQKRLKGFLKTEWKECFSDEFSNIL